MKTAFTGVSKRGFILPKVAIMAIANKIKK
jgi:hypothetical protein